MGTIGENQKAQPNFYNRLAELRKDKENRKKINFLIEKMAQCSQWIDKLAPLSDEQLLCVAVKVESELNAAANLQSKSKGEQLQHGFRKILTAVAPWNVVKGGWSLTKNTVMYSPIILPIAIVLGGIAEQLIALSWSSVGAGLAADPTGLIIASVVLLYTAYKLFKWAYDKYKDHTACQADVHNDKNEIDKAFKKTLYDDNPSPKLMDEDEDDSLAVSHKR
jgi:hypothetical protein